MSRSPVVLGISASHDASACIVRNGKLEIAIQLERLTRVKHDGQGFLHSRLAADYCLRALGMTAKDVDVFAFNAQPLMPEYVGLCLPTHATDFDLFDPFSEKALFVTHHLAHAFATFFCSPFDSAAVVILDGSGGRTANESDFLLWGQDLRQYLLGPYVSSRVHVGSTYVFHESGYELVERETAPSFNTINGSSSLGETYAAVTEFIFGHWQNGGKLMGLAPYGKADLFGPSLLIQDPSGRRSFSHHWKIDIRPDSNPKDPMDWINLAARIQDDLETAVLDRITRAMQKTKMRQLAYGGGIALNVRANDRIIRESATDSVYIMPASHDAGICIGAAAAAHFLLTSRTNRSRVRSDYLGYSYSEADYKSAIHHTDKYLDVTTANIKSLASILNGGKVLGWFEGASEFGPRSLGHRSIFAAPQDPAMRQRINRTIKYREDFRPFAPIVPLEYAADFFEIQDEAPFMLRAVQVRDTARHLLGAVMHVDGTCRVQTVTRESAPRVYDLLIAYGERSGIPVLLNTSLNIRRQPIVETALQAIELLLATSLDGLVLGDTLLEVPVNTVVDSDVMELAPSVEIQHARSSDAETYEVVSRFCGTRYELPSWGFELLSAIDGRSQLASAVNKVRGLELTQALELCDKLRRSRLLLNTRIEARTTENGKKVTYHN